MTRDHDYTSAVPTAAPPPRARIVWPHVPAATADLCASAERLARAEQQAELTERVPMNEPSRGELVLFAGFFFFAAAVVAYVWLS